MFSFEIQPHTLQFRFEAGTSRGVLKEKQSWFVVLRHSDFPGLEGWGEAGFLPGLSSENLATFESDLNLLGNFLLPQMEEKPRNWRRLSANWLENWNGPWLPSGLFAFETAWLDWVNCGKKLICDPDFHLGNWRVPINGLVWMNPIVTMEEQAREKKEAGFDTIKLKVGALNWTEEFELIKRIRSEMPASEIKIRLDANGAWELKEAFQKLEALAVLEIESIEQPIAVGQIEALADLCRHSPIPIALDEELNGKPYDHQKFNLLEAVEPQFIVLKPSLLGGLGQTNQWISMAEDVGIAWWITSMLESNVGLNAISQLAAQYRTFIPQGLGTGQLYSNNISSPLSILNGEIFSDPDLGWQTNLK
jgi:hypothetical protein